MGYLQAWMGANSACNCWPSVDSKKTLNSEQFRPKSGRPLLMKFLGKFLLLAACVAAAQSPRQVRSLLQQCFRPASTPHNLPQL